MTERDRLIELIRTASHELTTRCVGDCGDCADKIADYLLENGVIVPPMSIGQKCYVIGYDFSERQKCVVECKVSCLTQKKNGTFTIRISETKYNATHNFSPDEIGKTVFLTKEEAERVLRKEDEGK